MITLFFDTYAFYEIIVGNPNYAVYIKDIKIVTTQLNLMELYSHLLLIYPKQDALELFNRYHEFIVPISNQVIIEAMDFRCTNRRKRLSYVDCIGYIFSQENEMKFLTGDQKFEGKIGVEFVK